MSIWKKEVSESPLSLGQQYDLALDNMEERIKALTRICDIARSCNQQGFVGSEQVANMEAAYTKLESILKDHFDYNPDVLDKMGQGGIDERYIKVLRKR